MTTPANDETKKSDTSATSPATTTPQPGANDAPKKRKRKRKAKKPATTSTTTSTHHTHKKDDTHNKESEKKEHEPKESPAEEKEKKAEAAKPNLNIKSDTHMLPGIENIHDYIARKKAPPSHKSTKTEGVDSYTTPDGTELLKLPGLYALVPHAKGDHKLVYTTESEPVGLLDDPRKREKGAMYVKNGRDIYMVTLTMKEHPTLKDSHNESYDVWIIDTPQQLTDQLDAIKAGMGGGENFGAVIYPETHISTESETQKKTEATEESGEPEKEVTTENETHEEENLSQNNEESVETGIEDLTQQAETEGIDAIQLDLPTDDEFPEPDIDSTLTDQDDTKEDTEKETVDTSSEAETISLDGVEDHDTETEHVSENESQEEKEEHLQDEESQETNDSVSLDLHTAEDEASVKDESTPEATSPDSEEDTSDKGVSLDLHAGEEDLSEEQIAEDDDAGHMHFNTPEEAEQEVTSPEAEESPEEAAEETSGRSLFGSAQEETRNPESNDTLENTPEEETGGMFRQPSSIKTEEEVTTENETHEEEPAEIVDQSFTPDSPLFPGVHEAVAEDISETETTQQTQEVTSTVDVSALNLDDLTISEEKSNEDEPTPSSDQGSIDLDKVSPPDLEQATPQHTSALGASHAATTTKKGSFPFHIIIRIVLFIIIVGALILVWKIMFPKINGTKPVDTNTEVTTGVIVDDIPTTGEQDDDTLIPAEDDNQLSGTVIPPEEEIPVLDPNQGLTLNELTEKLKLQQTEARKVLNIAKLLENKQAIKFSLAAMLKAGNVLERIDTETTITAEDVLKESEKIDAYLMEASKLVE